MFEIVYHEMTFLKQVEFMRDMFRSILLQRALTFVIPLLKGT